MGGGGEERGEERRGGGQRGGFILCWKAEVFLGRGVSTGGGEGSRDNLGQRERKTTPPKFRGAGGGAGRNHSLEES